MAIVAEFECGTRDNMRLLDVGEKQLAPGAARLRIDNFAVTANNVTYALMGDRLGYWRFFPASLAWGIVPVWGHATVEASNHELLRPGERLFGFLPMASHLDIEVGNVMSASVDDVAPHRAQMSPFYNRYLRLGPDRPPNSRTELVGAIFQPLFATGVLLEQMLRDADWHGAERLIVTSASSKTALALAWVASTASPNIQRIGMTSAANRDYVLSTCLYHRVIVYDEPNVMADQPSVLVDIAGDAKTREDIHRQLGDSIRYSCTVGATRALQRRQATGETLQGPDPVPFFAPTRWEIAAAGRERQFEADVAGRFDRFFAHLDQRISLEPKDGLAAAIEAFRGIASGEGDPGTAITIRL